MKKISFLLKLHLGLYCEKSYLITPIPQQALTYNEEED